MGLPRLDSTGNYELLTLLAKGGMAELYLAYAHGAGGFQKLVAIKRILPHLAEDKQFRDMFHNEGRIAAHLMHPHICQVFQLDEFEGELFLVMEYLHGVSWEALIKEMPRDVTTLRLAAGVIAQACDGLHYAHELRDPEGNATPVVHRDVSPQNLFITADGVCKVLDFGVSKMAKDGPRTRTGVLKGKLPYMAPEQIQGESVDARADVFALGVIVWEALTGVALFDRDTDFLIWKAITEAPIPPLVQHGFPPEIDAVLAAALARPKDQRFQSARALAEALRRAADRVGGAYTPAQIAEVVRSRCADQLAERELTIKSVVGQRRSQPREPSAADTIEETAASTVSLRPDPIALDRPEPRRRRWPYVVAALAAAAAVAIGVVALSRDDTPAVVATNDVAAAPVPAVADPLSELGRAVDVIESLAGTKGGTKSGSGATAAESLDRIAKGVDTIHRNVDQFHAKLDGAPVNEDASSEPPAPVPAGKKPRPKPRPAVATVIDDIQDPSWARGTFTINSVPYATIYLDGNKLGDTPLFKVEVSQGAHTVRAVTADGREKTFKVTIRGGEHTNHGKLTW